MVHITLDVWELLAIAYKQYLYKFRWLQYKYFLYYLLKREDCYMTDKLEGTKTQQCLINAFAGESQARNRYTYFARAAKKEGYIQISNIFADTAENEKEHAKLFFKHLAFDLNRQAVEITASYPVALSDTKSNLLAAANGENEEWSVLYPTFADIATKENFPKIINATKNQCYSNFIKCLMINLHH